MFSEKSSLPFYQKALHIFLLSGFLFVQPLLDLIGANVEFLVARNVSRVEVYILLFALCVLIPCAITIIVAITRLLGRRVADAVYIAIIFVLTSSIFTLTLNSKIDMPSVALVVVAVILGIISSYAYVKYSIVRTYLNYLSPAIIIFPIFFLLNPQVIKITSSKPAPESAGITSPAHTPVVMVIFDELPIISLLDGDGLIDPVRYPNFSSLANDAIWFRNATAISGQTTKSVPAILSGLRPKNEWLPIAKDYPQTLFTLLKESHELEVYETQTSLCPDISCGGDIVLPSARSIQTGLAGLFSDISVIYLHLLLPKDFANKLPVVTQTWKDFRVNIHDENTESKHSMHWKFKRPVGFASFVNKISYSEPPRFYFTHTLLPHVPWKYLPSGKEYMTKRVYGVPGLDIENERWGNNDWLVTQGYQRHLLQVGFADKLLGDLFNKLKEQGLYKQSIIIITSDHGVSFWPNSSRRGITEQENRRDLFGVPLFIKLSNQERGVINDYAIRSIDILPTLAHILKVELPLEVDGSNAPLFPSTQESNPGVKHPYFDSKSLKRKLELFGSGEQNAKGLYRFGFYKELIGSKSRELTIKNDRDMPFTIDQIKDLYAVDFGKSFIPAYITGSILGVSKNIEELDLALAINGTIAAVTKSYPVKGEHKFSAIIPASSLQNGYNVTNVFAINEDQGTPVLSRLTEINASRVEPGRVYDFSDDTQASLFFGSGWSTKGDYGARWNVTDEASLSFLVKNNELPLELIVQSSQFFVEGKHELQEIEVSFLSGTKQFIKLQRGDTDGRFVIQIMPKDIGPGGNVVIDLKFLNAISPNSLGVNADTRLLAIRVKTIQVLTVKAGSN